MASVTYVISVAAELAGMHPQTLRQYDRLGIVIPQRTKGRGRRYTNRDVERLRQVQRLSQEEGINLEGIRRILALEAELDAARAEIDELRASVRDLQETVDEVERRRRRIFSANARGDVSAVPRGYRPSAPRPTGGEIIPRPRVSDSGANGGALVLYTYARSFEYPGQADLS